MPEGTKKTNRYTLLLLKLVLLILLAFPVCLLTARDIRQKWRERSIDRNDIETIFQMQDRNEELPPKYQKLWRKVEPTCIAFERIALDLETRTERKGRFFDRIYIEGLIDDLEKNIIAEPRLSLYLLGHYALHADTPLGQALALIAIRETYPKKYSVFFANRFVNSDQPLLANLSVQIVSGKYPVSSIRAKFNPRYIRTLKAQEDI